MNNTNNELDATSRGKQQNGEGGGGPGDQQDAENEEANWAMEAEESAIRLKVENGLKHIRDGDRARGKEAFEEVLKNDLKSSKTIKQLRFVAARNLAKALEEESTNVEVEKDDEKRRKLRARALELYVEAVDFDAKDVVVWHRLGTLAQELDNVVLARFAFSNKVFKDVQIHKVEDAGHLVNSFLLDGNKVVLVAQQRTIVVDYDYT